MPIIVVTGAPFSGKGQYMRSEIARSELEGELGLVAVDFTPLYAALVPGAQSSYRDEAVSDSGAPRWIGYLYAIAVAQVFARELSGYVSTPSPVRAIEIADRADAPIVDVPATVDAIAVRVNVHMRELSRTVPRATRDRTRGRCRRAAATYFRDEHRLVGRARVATTGARKQAFDRAAFERGLTPRARAVRDALIVAGDADPTPVNILSALIGA